VASVAGTRRATDDTHARTTDDGAHVTATSPDVRPDDPAAGLGFRCFDFDNHYYEAEDAFTRHIDRGMARRAMQWVEIRGRRRLLVGGRLNRYIPNPTFDPVSKPGALDEYFRGRNPEGRDTSELFGELEPISPAYRDRDARLAVMDAQGLEAAVFLPTLGVGMEQALVHDIPAAVAAFRAFNRWLDEDWGFAYRERIFAAPYITLCDPDEAVREVEWAIGRDARVLVMVGGPVATERGMRAPADPMFDGFWARVNEAGLTVVYHGGESHYTKYLADWGEPAEVEAFRVNPFRRLLSANPVQDTFASLLSHGLFQRFPHLRVAAIETGSDWVFHLFDKLKKSFGQTPQAWTEDPRETFRRHVWVAPFYEDALAGLRDLIGADRILMGSDFPHAEGLAQPAAFVRDLRSAGYSDADCRLAMRDNGRALTTRRAR
jgi:predicted TIM-barrel fold metal-dependent hydrolase